MQECLVLMLSGAFGCYTVPHAFHLHPARENIQVGSFPQRPPENMQDLKDRQRE